MMVVVPCECTKESMNCTLLNMCITIFLLSSTRVILLWEGVMSNVVFELQKPSCHPEGVGSLRSKSHGGAGKKKTTRSLMTLSSHYIHNPRTIFWNSWIK